MNKPTFAELSGAPEEFTRHEIRVPYYRRKSDGNLYFVTDKGEVFDKYVPVVDSSGVPHVAARRKLSFRWGRDLLRGALLLLAADKFSLPQKPAELLLGALGGNAPRARAVLGAVEMATTDPFAAAMSAIHEFGPREFQSVVKEIEKFDIARIDRDEFLAKLREIADQ